MKLVKIQGHSSYYSGATNVGVVRYKNGFSLIIDAGIDAAAGKNLAQALEDEGLKPKYVLVTHAHPDHFGAVKWLKEQYTGLQRYSSAGEAVYLANPGLATRMLYGAAPVKELESRYLQGPATDIDIILTEGDIEIGDKKFSTVYLPGHTHDQIGIISADGVLFAGDSLFSTEIIEKYAFPYLVDIEAQLQTIAKLSALDVQYTLLSHAKEVITNLPQLCEQNKHQIEHYNAKILEWCNQPLTREDIAEMILTETGREADLGRYYMTYSTTGAFLAYLANKQALAKSVIGGKCYFYRD